MKNYQEEYDNFQLSVPESFSFPLDVFDKWGNKPALFWTDGSDESRFSFQELKLLSAKGASALKGRGIKKGDKVIVMLPNIPEWWEIMLALMRINAVPIPATTLMTQDDIEFRLQATRIRSIITTGEDTAKVEEAINNTGISLELISIGSMAGWHDYIDDRKKSVPFEGSRSTSSEAALIYFTSGTTGPPKMVLHTQSSYPFAHCITGKYWLDLRPGDLHWNMSDPGWAKAAWSSLFAPWHMGATIFSYYHRGRFDPSLTVEVMKKYPVTTFCGPPTVYRMIAKEISSEEFNFRSLRHFVAAGEPLNKEIIDIWHDRTGEYIYDGYGQTETVNVLANFRCLPVKPGAMGVPVPGFAVTVLDADREPAPSETEGEIAIKISPERPAGLFSEYLDNPSATARCIEGGWYLTGDRAYIDKDGYFWFVGRDDDIILTSGYRIGPFEVESLLVEHPAVEESAVVASPDPLRGELVKAFVVLTKGVEASDEMAVELQELVKRETAPYKYPRIIEFVDSLPKTISGKIKRKELKMKEFSRDN